MPPFDVALRKTVIMAEAHTANAVGHVAIKPQQRQSHWDMPLG